MDLIRFSRGWWRAAAVFLAGSLLAGCASDPPFKFDPLTSNGASVAGGAPAIGTSPASGSGGQQVESGRVIRVGESFLVTFQDTVTPIPPVDVLVKENGKITLIYMKEFQAAGKTVGELEKDIHDAYVPIMFKNLTPLISLKERWYYVEGEVKVPGRQVYLSKMTVLQAIATAGDFTDFARKGSVKLIRANGKVFTVDTVEAQRNPELDLEVFPDDRVHVRKRWW
jgi:polysaccharide biosynthesis/export protein VpsN